jgi:hypothetical protein
MGLIHPLMEVLLFERWLFKTMKNSKGWLYKTVRNMDTHTIKSIVSNHHYLTDFYAVF